MGKWCHYTRTFMYVTYILRYIVYVLSLHNFARQLHASNISGDRLGIQFSANRPAFPGLFFFQVNSCLPEIAIYIYISQPFTDGLIGGSL